MKDDKRQQEWKKRTDAWFKIEEFVKQRGYTYSIESVIGSYILYVRRQAYFCHSMHDIMDNVGNEVKFLADVD